MIPLRVPVTSDAQAPFVTRLVGARSGRRRDSYQLSSRPNQSLWCGESGLFEMDLGGEELVGDVVLINPAAKRAERLIRASSRFNSLLVTEQCDQLCVMCSQPPKKTHVDRFDQLEQACLLAPPDMTIGITGGEPMIHAEALLGMVERALAKRPDLSFHILSNGQHFTADHEQRFRDPVYRRVVWGIPLYSAEDVVHDAVVGKPGAYERLLESFAHLLLGHARIELRTVLIKATVAGLGGLATFVTQNLPFIEQWSLMGLENIGFARNRWRDLAIDTRSAFSDIGPAIDWTTLFGVHTRLFNIPLCHLPGPYRPFAAASISDWKQRFGTRCASCSQQSDCSGFFAWHPDELVEEVDPL